MVCLSILYILGILVGLPLAIYFILHNHKKAGTLHSVQAEWQWGFVHVAFEVRFPFADRAVHRQLDAGVPLPRA